MTLAAVPAAGQGPPSDPEPDRGLSDRLRKGMQTFVDQKEIAGAVVLVGSRDRIVGLAAVGRRCVEDNLFRSIDDDFLMKHDTLFRIASMTKPITAFAVMLLAEQGELALDDPVEKYLPEFRGQMMVADRSEGSITLKKPARPITLRDLLTHTSGLPGLPPPGLSDLYARRNHTLAEAVMAFSQRPLEFEPGSKWAYSNAGIDTLGRIVEVITGRPYETLLKERIFTPLGMDATTFYPTPEQLRNAAVTYDRKGGALQPVASSLIGPPAGAKYPIPAGGLYSTAPDLARFYRMMLARGETAADIGLVPTTGPAVPPGTMGTWRALSAASVDEMTRLQTGDLKAGFTEGMGFGLGWGVVRQPTGVTERLSAGSYGHGGAYGTQAWIDPHKGRFAILMIQRVGLQNGDASEMRRALQEIAFGAGGK
jgi:CubicO group peptidase (beta-lactamase class C family)